MNNINRATFFSRAMKIATCSFACLSFFGCSASSPDEDTTHESHKAEQTIAAVSTSEMPADLTSSTERKPNIIFIFADDWGYGDLSLHGSDFVETPNLDAMAKEGIDFAHFTVNSPVCSPSRTAVMTGQFPARHRIHQHFASPKANKARGMPDWLDTNIPLLPKLLKNAGYKTGHFGKWHLGASNDAPLETEYGYDEYATFSGSNTHPVEIASLSSVYRVEDFIQRHKDQPFFINMWLHETHLPHLPLNEYMEKFDHLDEQKQVYAAVVADGDAAVGRVLSLLKKLNIDDNTLVVFSSDNGPEFARDESAKEHHGKKKGLGGYYSVGETGGLKGEKRSLYAGGIRVPFIVRWPGKVPAGRIDRTSVLTAVDLLPTFLEVAGVPLPENFSPDGETILPAFLGQPFERSKPIYWEWLGPKERASTWPRLGIRDGRWKLILNHNRQRLELYDLNADWAESQDVSAEYPDVVQHLSEKLASWKASLPPSPEQ